MRPTAALATFVLVLAAGIAYAALGPAGHRPGSEPRPGAAVAAIAGEVTGLYPGREARVVATVVSRSPDPLWLLSISARARPASRSCPEELLRIRRRELHDRIPARGRARVGLVASLAPRAPDACQGETWPLRFHARVSPRPSIGR